MVVGILFVVWNIYPCLEPDQFMLFVLEGKSLRPRPAAGLSTKAPECIIYSFIFQHWFDGQIMCCIYVYNVDGVISSTYDRR